VHLQEEMRRTRKAFAAIEQRGLAATPARLAAETGFDVEEVVAHLRHFAGVVSLDLAVGDDGLSFLGDFVRRGDTGLGEILDRARAKAVDDLLDTALTEREAAVLRLRFGFGGDEPLTLDEIGKIFNVTRERIRQIEGKALGKLREPRFAQLLESS
jgi:RNA polymerase primary sigma factor